MPSSTVIATAMMISFFQTGSVGDPDHDVGDVGHFIRSLRTCVTSGGDRRGDEDRNHPAHGAEPDAEADVAPDPQVEKKEARKDCGRAQAPPGEQERRE